MAERLSVDLEYTETIECRRRWWVPAVWLVARVLVRVGGWLAGIVGAHGFYVKTGK